MRSRAAWRLAAVVLPVLFACRQPHSPPEDPDAEDDCEDEPNGWSVRIERELPGLVDAFVDHAEAYGCAVKRLGADDALATCTDMKVLFRKRGMHVHVRCNGGVTRERCRATFDAIVAAPVDLATPPSAAASASGSGG